MEQEQEFAEEHGEICIHIYKPDKITVEEMLAIMSYILNRGVLIEN